MKLIIISGRSGSGKSIAVQVLEDIGFYCIDNLPAALLHETVNYLQQLKQSDDETQDSAQATSVKDKIAL